MAVLGTNGIVRFRRDAPEPIILPYTAMRADIDTFLVSNQDFWNGDEVRVFSPNGLPISPESIPEGVGCYFGSFWELGPNRDHVTAPSDPYYALDSAYFYNRGTPINTATYYIYRDSLDRISLYETRTAALGGAAADRVDLRQLRFDYILLSATGTEEYDNALAQCIAAAGPYALSDVTDEITLSSICDSAPLFDTPLPGVEEYNDADLTPRRWINGFPWIIQGCIAQWSIELSGENLSTTAVGDKFGENIKSLITGGGSFDFDVDRFGSEDTYDSTSLLQLLLLTEKGSKAKAQFFMIANRQPEEARPTLSPGSLYYECDILITNSAINTRAGEIIVGTANFVTTGPIELKIGT